MCSNSDNIIINENFKPIAIGMSMGQHKIGQHNKQNVYSRKNQFGDGYFIQMSQKAFADLDIETLPDGTHEQEFTVSKEILNRIKEKLED